MKLTLTSRRQLLGLVGVLALVAAGSSAPRQDSDVKSPAATARPAMHPNAGQAQRTEPKLSQAALDKLGSRAVAEDAAVDLFKGKSWFVPPPPPPPAPALPPPAPTAPPLPYAFLGSYRGEDGRLIIFLTRSDRIYSVSPGDMLENTYRVEEIASGQLVLTYLPLNVRQTINIGEAAG